MVDLLFFDNFQFEISPIGGAITSEGIVDKLLVTRLLLFITEPATNRMFDECLLILRRLIWDKY